MKYLPVLLFTFFTGLVLNIKAQSPDLELLLKNVNESKGKEKIRALAEISMYYYVVNPSLGIEYGKKALRMADSLKLPSEKGKIYNNLGANYLALSEFDTAKVCFAKALSTAQHFNDSTESGNALNRLGLVYEKLGFFDSSLMVFHQAAIIFQQLRNDERTGRIFENIGTIHLHRGEQKTALINFLEAMNYFEKAGATKNLPSLYLKIGRISAETKDYSNADKWYEKGKKLSLELGDFQTAALAMNAIGVTYKNQGKYEEALKWYLEVIEIVEKIGNNDLLIAVYGNIGNVYIKMGSFDKSLVYHRKALQIAETLNNPVEIAVQHVGIGIAYNGNKDYFNASKYFEKALSVFDKFQMHSNRLVALKGIIEACNGLKNYEQSMFYYENYLSLKDSLTRYELNTALDSLKVKFNTEQTQKENTLLAQKTEIQQKTISLQRTFIGSIIIIAVLLTGFLLLIIHNRKKIREANRLLEEKNAEIEAKADELKKTNQKLIELSGFKDSLQSFLVHDLKNPLNKLMSLSAGNITEVPREEIFQTGKHLLHIVSNLLDINKYENSVMKLDLQPIALSYLLHNAIKETQYLCQQKSIAIFQRFPFDYILKIDQEIMTRVLVNLLTNAIKFSPTGGQIHIQADPAGEFFVILRVMDQGPGIPMDVQACIFDKYCQAQVRHLGYAGSTGIGLTFCKLAVESHGGSIGFNSEENMGTVFWVNLPYLSASECQKEEGRGEADFHSVRPGYDFTEGERIYLGTYCNRLKNLSIWQISDVKEIVKEIEPKSDTIAAWKCQVIKALSACDEARFQELVNSGKYGAD